MSRHRRINRRDGRFRVRIPYAIIHAEGDDPPYPGADKDWLGTRSKRLPGLCNRNQMPHIEGYYLRVPESKSADGAMGWRDFPPLEATTEAREHLHALWRDGSIRLPSMTRKECFYLNWDGWSCSSWVDGFRGFVTHVPGRWHPRRMMNGTNARSEPNLSEYVAYIMDAEGCTMGLVSPRCVGTDLEAHDGDERTALHEWMERILGGDDGWTSRTQAHAGVSFVLANHLRGHPTHAVRTRTVIGTPLLQYLADVDLGEDPTFMVLDAKDCEPVQMGAWSRERGMIAPASS